MHEQIRVQKILIDHFESIKKRNPSYSMRSFAKKLNIASSTLSELFNGKRMVSKRLTNKLLRSLDIPQKEVNDILSLFPKRKREFAQKGQSPYWKLLKSEDYKLISE